jgi:hypothetical protein
MIHLLYWEKITIMVNQLLRVCNWDILIVILKKELPKSLASMIK